MIWGSGGSKSRLAKAAGAEPAGQMRDEKLHAVVARSTFPSQNVQSKPGSDHFWKLRCRKSVHRCGAKHISKSKCTKHHMPGPLFDVQMPFRVAGAPCQKWAKRDGFVAFPKTMAGVSTSKSGPDLVCFVHFVFEMCFAPQRRALFRHLNFQKWSGHGVFCTFWLENVLRATTACNFSSLICPAGSAPAALASLLFDPPERQIIGKTQCFATFLPFHFHASASSFFWLFLFYSSLLSDSSHLCFSSVHIAGSLTSKLPSATLHYTALITLITSNYI